MAGERSTAQFFFEVGYGSCFAEALVRNGSAPFELTDAIVERAWEIAPEAHDDHQEFDLYLAAVNDRETLLTAVREMREEIERAAAFAETERRWAETPDLGRWIEHEESLRATLTKYAGIGE